MRSTTRTKQILAVSGGNDVKLELPGQETGSMWLLLLIVCVIFPLKGEKVG